MSTNKTTRVRPARCFSIQVNLRNKTTSEQRSHLGGATGVVLTVRIHVQYVTSPGVTTGFSPVAVVRHWLPSIAGHKAGRTAQYSWFSMGQTQADTCSK